VPADKHAEAAATLLGADACAMQTASMFEFVKVPLSWGPNAIREKLASELQWKVEVIRPLGHVNGRSTYRSWLLRTSVTPQDWSEERGLMLQLTEGLAVIRRAEPLRRKRETPQVWKANASASNAEWPKLWADVAKGAPTGPIGPRAHKTCLRFHYLHKPMQPKT
jgi:hypothetical protein